MRLWTARIAVVATLTACSNEPFDATRWKADPASRNAMTSALVEKLKSDRPSREATIELLGPPMREHPDSLMWDVGTCNPPPFFLEDHCHFVVKFDGDTFEAAWSRSIY